jgi:hypothetical protein
MAAVTATVVFAVAGVPAVVADIPVNAGVLGVASVCKRKDFFSAIQ